MYIYITLEGPKSITERSQLEFNTLSPAGDRQQHFSTVTNKVKWKSDLQLQVHHYQGYYILSNWPHNKILSKQSHG